MKRVLVATAVALAAGSFASADVIFDNMPGDIYNTGTGATISDGAPLNQDWDQGNGFTVAGNFFLDRIEIAIGHVTGTNGATITVYDDNAGQPGTALEAVHISGMGSFGSNNPPVQVEFSNSTLLQNGQQYWVIASSDANSWLAWNWNSSGHLGNVAWRLDLGAWNTASNATTFAMRVHGLVVPAPGALALLGLSGLAPRRRHR